MPPTESQVSAVTTAEQSIPPEPVVSKKKSWVRWLIVVCVVIILLIVFSPYLAAVGYLAYLKMSLPAHKWEYISMQPTEYSLEPVVQSDSSKQFSVKDMSFLTPFSSTTRQELRSSTKFLTSDGKELNVAVFEKDHEDNFATASMRQYPGLHVESEFDLSKKVRQIVPGDVVSSYSEAAENIILLRLKTLMNPSFAHERTVQLIRTQGADVFVTQGENDSILFEVYDKSGYNKAVVFGKQLSQGEIDAFVASIQFAFDLSLNRSYVPNYEGTSSKQIMLISSVIVSLEEYKKRHGKYPASLADMSVGEPPALQDFLESTSVDPFSSKPFHYVSLEDGKDFKLCATTPLGRYCTNKEWLKDTSKRTLE